MRVMGMGAECREPVPLGTCTWSPFLGMCEGTKGWVPKP